MKLTGIIEEVFRGVTIFRGYATLKTLAKLSSTTSYQREYSVDRIDEILHYMKDSQFLFFPELILGWRINDLSAIRKIKEEETTSSISIENGIKIKKARFRFKNLLDGEEPTTKVVTIEIPDSVINQPIFNRIDGNHRLAVVDKVMQDNTENEHGDVCTQVAPFSLIMQNNNVEAEKYEAAYFFLVNSKAVSLTSEQNLKSIFSYGSFNDAEKTNLAIVKDIKRYEDIARIIVNGRFSFVTELFQDEAYYLALRIYDNIESHINIDSIKKALIQIEAFYNAKELPENNNIIISLIVAYASHDKKCFEQYKKWLSDNQLIKIKDIRPQELLSSFEELKSIISVFVAMPYFSEERVKSSTASFKTVFDNIQKKYGIPIQLIDNDGIMTYEGQTLDIVDNIMDKIKRCSIFVCDITDNNPNVTYEFGRAAALGKPIIVLREKDSCEPKSDFNRYYYEQYDKTAHVTYEQAIEKHIIACLKKDFHFNSILDFSVYDISGSKAYR